VRLLDDRKFDGSIDRSFNLDSVVVVCIWVGLLELEFLFHCGGLNDSDGLAVEVDLLLVVVVRVGIVGCVLAEERNADMALALLGSDLCGVHAGVIFGDGLIDDQSANVTVGDERNIVRRLESLKRMLE